MLLDHKFDDGGLCQLLIVYMSADEGLCMRLNHLDHYWSSCYCTWHEDLL